MVVLIAVVAALVYRGEDAPDDAAPVTTVEPDAGGTEVPTTTAPPASDPTALDAVLDEAIAFVEAERGHRFVTRPVVEVLADAEFVASYDALLDEAFAEDPAAVEAATVVYRAFGLIAPDQDIEAVERSFGAELVLGYYNTETNKLVVRAADLTPYFRTILVHELTHALDDQLFELYRPQYDDADDEVGFGLSAVAEGNARRVEYAYRDTMSDEERADADREAMRFGAGIDFGVFTDSYLMLQFAPYDFGEAFVEELLAERDEADIDEALQEPPTTSEQVMDPDAYFRGEPRVEIDRPTADPAGIVVDEGVLGQVAILSILYGSVGYDDAFAAADGWAGDWFVGWTDGPQSCVRAAIVMDDGRQASELRDVFDAWADDQPGDTTVEDEGDRVEVTSCVG
jgi:hypothetical protein